MLYFDHAATTYPLPAISKKYQEINKDVFGNASSLHSFGRKAKRKITIAQEMIADHLYCSPEEVYFTSGGTESNNLAIKGVCENHGFKGHIITSEIEHHCVLNSFQYVQNLGMEVTFLSVDKFGQTNLKDFKNAIKKDTVLVSIMYANNEIGTIQPISKMSEITKENNILLHTDAVQAGGSLDCSVQKLGVDLLTLSGHKFYGPKGVGILYKKNGLKLPSQMHGGEQQNHLRAGTYNTPGIVATAYAFDLAQKNKENENKRLMKMRDMLIKQISKECNAKIVGHPTQRLVNNINVAFRNIDSNTLMMRLDNQGVAVSTGSACTSGNSDISHVIKALNLPTEYSKGVIRISLGKKNSMNDCRQLIKILKQEINAMRG